MFPSESTEVIPWSYDDTHVSGKEIGSESKKAACGEESKREDFSDYHIIFNNRDDPNLWVDNKGQPNNE